jgi:outer membrane protein assembly factor BamB
VYVGSRDHDVYAFDARTGAVLWQGATSDEVDSCPAVWDGAVYAGSYDGGVYSFTL